MLISYSFWELPPNDSIVSFKETNFPFLPEKTSDMKKGCERNFWTFLALATVILSSSLNSSIPKIAIISCKLL